MEYIRDIAEEHNRAAWSFTNAKKAGYLHLSKFRRNYKRRWFILHEDFLYYYMDDGKKKPKGVISLSEFDTVKIPGDRYREHSFKLSKSNSKHPSVLLAADSDAEMTDWASILTTLTHLKWAKTKYGFGLERVEFGCNCKVFEAKLVDKELVVDSYCTVYADKVHKGRTNTVFSTGAPVFDEEFEFEIQKNAKYIIVQLKDASMRNRRDNVIGQVAIPIMDLEDHKVNENWYKMTPGLTTLDPTGNLKFCCSVTKNKIKIDNIKASGLTPMDSGGLADPFIQIIYGNKKEKTTIVKRNLNPCWLKQPITFDQCDDKTPIIFEIYHADKDSFHEFMGEVRLPIQDATEINGNEEVEFKIQKRTESPVIGEMRISLQTRKAFILPDKHYDALFQLLIDEQNTMSLTKKLVAVSNKKEKPIAECLVKTFEMKRSAVHFIKMITAAEIQSTSDPNIIFRGNTVATKALDMYMRLNGMPYLISIMKPIVQTIILNEKKKISCELDEYRIDDKPEKKTKNIEKKSTVPNILCFYYF